MKLLVTGGAGFIGSHFVRYWLKENPQDEIINLDALTYAGNVINIADCQSLKNHTFIKGDIRDEVLLDDLLPGVDMVVHFAAESHVDHSISNPGVFLETNVLGTHALLKASLKHKVKRFHHVSTDEVFGSLGKEGSFNLSTPYNPRSPYAASKAASDHLVRAYYHTFKLPVTISNCSNNYGPYHFPEKFIPLAITNLLQDKKIPVYGDGSNRRDWIHVTDHVKGISQVLKKGQAGQTYLFAGPDGDVSNFSVAQKLVELAGKDDSSIEHVEDRKGHDWRYSLDDSQTRKELGWSPDISLEVGLADTVEWYQQNQKWWQDILSGEYKQYNDEV